jgi:hypothetical protein
VVVGVNRAARNSRARAAGHDRDATMVR